MDTQTPPQALPMYAATPVEERTRATRREIATAAARLFHTHGFADTTMSSVAALAGVSPRTLYRHYGSKNALFAATVALHTADFVEALRSRLNGGPIKDAIVGAFVDTAPTPDDETHRLMSLVCSEDEVWQYWLASAYRLQPHLAAVLRDASELRGGDAASDLTWSVRAGLIVTALVTAYQQWSATTTTATPDLIALVESAVSLIEPVLTTVSTTEEL